MDLSKLSGVSYKTREKGKDINELGDSRETVLCNLDEVLVGGYDIQEVLYCCACALDKCARGEYKSVLETLKSSVIVSQHAVNKILFMLDALQRPEERSELISSICRHYLVLRGKRKEAMYFVLNHILVKYPMYSKKINSFVTAKELEVIKCCTKFITLI